ncbi:DUF1697 domain-containing protein [Pseudolabrys taiwanensis]|uniref:DUF1697 domain-containing protein n=1 Tax=Pseudolabrys taiwanensis TaxID=331696 RepID=A0A345ZXY6_9HYPH|nr:DUF1697 domain-containing protein [Pseudolabrys taiwanensis]AXK81783.1 DUF1697 domain-containing protein [Pseudolabrys taiwanensis]
MTAYVALLRAVNVGGTGKLPMTELKAMCEAEGFAQVRTYIASGNVVFTAAASESKVKAALEARLHRYAGSPVPVAIRTAREMTAVLEGNPFPHQPANKTVAIFLDGKPPKNVLAGVKGQADEEIELGARELYVYFPSGQGRSKLKIPAAQAGTARNMNTVAALAKLVLGL